MPIAVRIPTVLRPLAGGEAIVVAEGTTVGEVFTGLDGRYPGLGERLLDGSGGLHPFVNVFLGDEDVRYLDGLDTRTIDGDEISIIPAVAGG